MRPCQTGKLTGRWGLKRKRSAKVKMKGTEDESWSSSSHASLPETLPPPPKRQRTMTKNHADYPPIESGPCRYLATCNRSDCTKRARNVEPNSAGWRIRPFFGGYAPGICLLPLQQRLRKMCAGVVRQA
jgi:hypothetical protein